MVAIPGATNLKYITTKDDIGYNLMIRATGDDEKISGFNQLMIDNTRLLQENRVYTSNMSDSGFTLNLYKSVPGLKADELKLTDSQGNIVAISGVTQGKNAAIYHISAKLNRENGPFNLSNNLENPAEYWRITSPLGQGYFKQNVQVPYAPEAREVTLKVPAGSASLYHMDVIVTNALTSKPIIGLSKEDFMITFGESGIYSIDELGAGGEMGEEAGRYILFPNMEMIHCPVMGYPVRDRKSVG